LSPDAPVPVIKWRELISAETQAPPEFRNYCEGWQQTFYEVLQVAHHARPEVIRAAYRALIEKFHPDKNSEAHRCWAERISKQLNEAYAVLMDPEKRRKYDFDHGITGRS
jgi:DnaJ-class molecular chaperone